MEFSDPLRSASTASRSTQRTNMNRWPPLIILLPSVVVAASVLLPLVYLVLRSFEAGADVSSFILRPRTLGVVWRSLALAFCVTTASLALALAYRLAHAAHGLGVAAALVRVGGVAAGDPQLCRRVRARFGLCAWRSYHLMVARRLTESLRLLGRVRRPYAFQLSLYALSHP